MAQNLGCFELSAPLLSEKQNLAPGNQNVWVCQGLGISRMGYNLLWVQLELEKRLQAGAGWQSRDTKTRKHGPSLQGKKSSGWGQSLKATIWKS